MASTSEKFCRRCGEWWPADDEFFFRNASNPDGLAYSCKACYFETPSVIRREARKAVGTMRSPWEYLLGYAG